MNKIREIFEDNKFLMIISIAILLWQFSISIYSFWICDKTQKLEDNPIYLKDDDKKVIDLFMNKSTCRKSL